MSQPTGNDPVWCTTPDGTHINTEPSAGQKATGWAVNQIPPSSYFNWWQNKVGEWVVYLKGLASEAFTWTAAHTFSLRVTASNGVLATPDGIGNPALQGVGGADGVGVAGSSNSVGVYGEGNGSTAANGVEGLGGSLAGNGVKGTGGDAGPGVVGVGGATSGKGVTGQGTGTGAGVAGTGGATGIGVQGTGGSTSGAGVSGTGGATGGRGVQGTGTAGANGGYFTGGPTAGLGVSAIGGGTTGVGLEAIGGTSSGLAIDAMNGAGASNVDVIKSRGYIDLSASSNPAASDSVPNRVTPKSLIKVWAHFTLVTGSAPTVQDGMNLHATPMANAAGLYTLTFKNSFSSVNYVAVWREPAYGSVAGGTWMRARVQAFNVGSIDFEVYNDTDVSTLTEVPFNGKKFGVLIVGAQ